MSKKGAFHPMSKKGAFWLIPRTLKLFCRGFYCSSACDLSKNLGIKCDLHARLMASQYSPVPSTNGVMMNKGVRFCPVLKMGVYYTERKRNPLKDIVV